LTVGRDGWFDGSALRLVRPYAVCGGRTRPTRELDLVSLVIDTGQVDAALLESDHAHVLGLCRGPTSVAEVAAYMRLPVVVAKILVADLIDCGALTTSAPRNIDVPFDRELLEAVRDGLRQRL
jgi:hypothetical protein